MENDSQLELNLTPLVIGFKLPTMFFFCSVMMENDSQLELNLTPLLIGFKLPTKFYLADGFHVGVQSQMT